ncbi:MAG: hypothetical protein J5I90_07880 [Caldilineales bacterium]|nr:hypothetical protein [Caldilineales bacterium]
MAATSAPRPAVNRWLPALPLLVAALLALALRNLAVDDAFVTYRYAANLARGLGFVYNPGEQVLSTTAPFYGLLLALPVWLGWRLPLVSNALGGLAIGSGGLALALIGRSYGWPGAGLLGGLFYVLMPLLWLALGMETALFLALVLAAFAADANSRSGWAGVFLGLAVITRYDAALAAAILFLWRWLQDRRPSWRMILAAGLVAAPVLLYLTLTFGSPLPVTLSAKQSQTDLGVTGFFAGTSYVQGLGVLLRGWWAQTWLYVLPVAAMALGLAVAVWRERWALPLVIWAILHAFAYQALSVAPYFWYYAPLIPAAAVTMGVGVWAAFNWAGQRFRLGKSGRSAILIVLTLLVSLPLVLSLTGIFRALSASLPDPSTALSKVLPEAKTESYRQAGVWLAANTPPDASVGVTEVGVMGFFSQRPMVDFLGLIQPDAAAALGRGDPLWTLYTYQPDYLALIAANPLYNVDPRGDDWFQAAYEPVHRIDDPRFWGSPVTIYERRADAVDLPSAEIAADPPLARFGDQIDLLAVEPQSAEVMPGQALPMRMLWRADEAVAQDLRVSVQLLGKYDRVLAQRDSIPGLGARPSAGWQPGEIVPDLALIGIPAAACAPDEGVLNIVLYDADSGERLPVKTPDQADASDSLRLGEFQLIPEPADTPIARFANSLTLNGYDLSARLINPGETITLTLGWGGSAADDADLSAFVHLINEQTGERVAQADGPPILGGDRRSLTLPPDLAPGIYRPVIGLYHPQSGGRLAVVDAVGQPITDSLNLCPVRVEG